MEYSVIRKVVPREKGVSLIDWGKEVVPSGTYEEELGKILSIEKQKG